MVILPNTREVHSAQYTKKPLSRRMDDWEKGNFLALVQETERDVKTYLAFKRNGTTAEQGAKIFNLKVPQGEL
jgi:hypothetical protein